MGRFPVLLRARLRIQTLIGTRTDSIPKEVVPFVVLASPRSGSNLLMERLTSQWHSLRSDGEILGDALRGKSSVDEILRRTYYVDSGHRYVGCKIMAHQIEDSDLSRFLETGEIRTILLERRNVVRQFVSLKIAESDGIFKQPSVSERAAVTRRRVQVHLGDLLQYREKRDEWYRRFTAATNGMSILHIYYEGLSTDLDREIRRVADFLGLGEPDVVVPPRLRRQNPEPLRDLISNFESLREQLADLGEIGLVADLDA